MTLEQARRILREQPRLHIRADGTPHTGGLSIPLGDRLIDEIQTMERPRIAETGSGLSTLVFLCLDPSMVISVSPAPELHERVYAAASERGIDTSALRFVNDRSESALPILALVEGVAIDVAFIDGNHGWPAVFVDFCYLNAMLRPGGLMFIDDIQVYAVSQLVGLLKQQEPHYELVSIDGKLATFRKGLDLAYLPDWVMQPFITGNTASSSQRSYTQDPVLSHRLESAIARKEQRAAD